MKASELRIGNLIGMNLKDDDQNFFKVLEVAQEAMKTGACGMRFDLVGEIHYHDADFFEPIPLTPEWLERLGFTHDEGISWFYSLDYNKDVDTFKVFLLPDDSGYGVINIHGFGVCLKHVHSLQNLYFCLTQKELQYEADRKV